MMQVVCKTSRGFPLAFSANLSNAY